MPKKFNKDDDTFIGPDGWEYIVVDDKHYPAAMVEDALKDPEDTDLADALDGNADALARVRERPDWKEFLKKFNRAGFRNWLQSRQGGLGKDGAGAAPGLRKAKKRAAKKKATKGGRAGGGGGGR